MRSILVHAHDDGYFGKRLDVALDLARAFGGHLTILHTFPYSVGTMTDLHGAAFAAMAPVWKEQATEMREAVTTDMANEDVPWDWREAAGPAALGLLRHSSLMDLIVIGEREPIDCGKAPSWTAGELALSASCPVLVLPEKSKLFDAQAPALVTGLQNPAMHCVRRCLSCARRDRFFSPASPNGTATIVTCPPLAAPITSRGTKSRAKSSRSASRTTTASRAHSTKPLRCANAVWWSWAPMAARDWQSGSLAASHAACWRTFAFRY